MSKEIEKTAIPEVIVKCGDRERSFKNIPVEISDNDLLSKVAFEFTSPCLSINEVDFSESIEKRENGHTIKKWFLQSGANSKLEMDLSFRDNIFIKKLQEENSRLKEELKKAMHGNEQLIKKTPKPISFKFTGGHIRKLSYEDDFTRAIGMRSYITVALFGNVSLEKGEMYFFEIEARSSDTDPPGVYVGISKEERDVGYDYIGKKANEWTLNAYSGHICSGSREKAKDEEPRKLTGSKVKIGVFVDLTGEGVVEFYRNSEFMGKCESIGVGPFIPAVSIFGEGKGSSVEISQNPQYYSH